MKRERDEGWLSRREWNHVLLPCVCVVLCDAFGCAFVAERAVCTSDLTRGRGERTCVELTEPCERVKRCFMYVEKLIFLL